ncbi:HNH endonuclease [Vibrio parahaemolyticus]|uniref:HNH endonuclease n=1 Tax=Vibrio parahaemolyticus TaxID=670 RepID=UPI000423DDE8|nr:HNH endonuclease [Vibrio parahaemolyticus]
MNIKPISFPAHYDELIKNKLNCPDFNIKTWEDSDLDELRKYIKDYYITAQNYICPYCLQETKSKHGRYWDIEHIIPRVQTVEFMFEPLNLCVSCVECNVLKGETRTTRSVAKVNYPKRRDLYNIIHPFFDDYHENIIPVKVGLFYYPKQEKGRVTIDCCGLNRFYQFADYVPFEESVRKISELIELADNAKSPEIKKNIMEKISSISLGFLVKSSNK